MDFPNNESKILVILSGSPISTWIIRSWKLGFCKKANEAGENLIRCPLNLRRRVKRGEMNGSRTNWKGVETSTGKGLPIGELKNPIKKFKKKM